MPVPHMLLSVNLRPCFLRIKSNRTGHFARSWPRNKSNVEAPGHSESTSRTETASRTSCVETRGTTGGGEELTEQELESLLSQCRLKKERQLLEKEALRVCNLCRGKPSVGPSLYLDLTVGGVPTVAMVDTGSQSTIISRSLLHRIAKQCRLEGKDLPSLVQPTAHLFGKDGQRGGHELVITAQVDLILTADGVSVVVPVFVQPDSTQECLLGMNAAPLLGLTFLDGKGQPLCTVPDTVRESSEYLYKFLLLRLCLFPTVNVALLKQGWLVNTVRENSFCLKLKGLS